MPIASGMSQVFESMIPDDVKAAIKEAREKLPAVIEAVKTKVDQIQARVDQIHASQKQTDAKIDLLLATMSNLRLELVPGAVPEETATAAAAFGLIEVKNGGGSNRFDS